MKQSQRWNNLQICPRRDSNTGGSDLWCNTLPLDHGGAHLCERKQHVSIRQTIREAIGLIFGARSPTVCPLQIPPCQDSGASCGIRIYIYVDDTQAYTTMKITNETSRAKSVEKLDICISEYQSSIPTLLETMLCMLVMHRCYQTSFSATSESRFIKRSVSNSTYPMLCKSSFFQLRSIRSLKPHLYTDALMAVAHAFIVSRIDYHSSLFIGIPDIGVNQLQHIPNCVHIWW